MKPLLKFALARLAEPSTLRGAILLLSAAGITIAPELQQAIVTLGLGIAGLLGVVLPDAGNTAE